MRLDNFLFEKKYTQSRNKAKQMIKDRLVLVNGVVVDKASFQVESDAKIEFVKYDKYVSRGAYKLKGVLDEISLNLQGKTALDIGSSTGGFTQVLLEYGAKKVYAVDVGKNQLHKTLRDDERVEVFEECDIRKFSTDQKFEIVVSDVAFISLLYILDDIKRVASKDIILLFKPQFEVGKDVKRDKNGVVLDKKAIENAMLKFEDTCALKGFQIILKMPSPIKGKEGNQEWCYYMQVS